MINVEELRKDSAEQQTFEKGQIIIREGDIANDRMYIMLEGTAVVYKNYEKQGEVAVAELAPGDFFGEMSLFLKKVRTATVIAKEDATALVIDPTNIHDFLKSRPDAAFTFIQTLCKRLDKTNIGSSELQATALSDPLTGVYNRRFFMESAKSLIANTTRAGKIPYVVLFDLDHFKKVNDTYGHPAGDAVLRTFADTVSAEARSGDIFARYGGEEFVMIIGCADKEGAWTFVERIRKITEKMMIVFEDTEISVTTSIGVAAVPSDGDVDMAVSYADQALYEAKGKGRNRTEFFEGEIK